MWSPIYTSHLEDPIYFAKAIEAWLAQSLSIMPTRDLIYGARSSRTMRVTNPSPTLY